MGGVGLAVLAVSAIFAAQSAAKNKDSLTYCPNVATKCYAPGVALRNDAFSAATVSTVTFVSGTIVLTAGAVVLLTTSAGKRKTTATIQRLALMPILDFGSGSLTLRGDW